jgi:hypothetical protein
MDPVLISLGQQLAKKLGGMAVREAAQQLGYSGWEMALAKRAALRTHDVGDLLLREGMVTELVRMWLRIRGF